MNLKELESSLLKQREKIEDKLAAVRLLMDEGIIEATIPKPPAPKAIPSPRLRQKSRSVFRRPSGIAAKYTLEAMRSLSDEGHRVATIDMVTRRYRSLTGGNCTTGATRLVLLSLAVKGEVERVPGVHPMSFRLKSQN